MQMTNALVKTHAGTCMVSNVGLLKL